MTDKTQQAINLGQRAESLLNNDLWQATWLAMSEEYWEEFKATPPNGELDRTLIWCKAKVIEDVKKKFEMIYANGRAAKRKIEI